MSDCKRAGAYLALARDYAEAAGVVVGKRADLRAHAHELALKAQVLRGEGDEAWLMSSVGHNLEKAMRTVLRSGASSPIPREIARLIEAFDVRFAEAFQTICLLPNRALFEIVRFFYEERREAPDLSPT